MSAAAFLFVLNLSLSIHSIYFFRNGVKIVCKNPWNGVILRKQKSWNGAKWKEKFTSRHNISPIEVKSTKNYTTVSLNKFRQKYAQALSTPFIIHTKDLKVEDGIVYLPLYMTPLI